MSAPFDWTWPPRTILVAVDFGEASARALALAGLLGDTFGASIRAIHVERLDAPPYFTLEQLTRLEDERRAARRAAAEHLAAFAHKAGAPHVEPVIRDDSPVDAILEEGERADVIVLGTHGRRGPGRWWLGSVAERVVRAARVPVLVTRVSEDPVRNAFARVTFVGDSEAARARSLADDLARLGGGRVAEGGSRAACARQSVDGATLIVLPHEPDGGALHDSVDRVLTSCGVPVLFVPSVAGE